MGSGVATPSRVALVFALFAGLAGFGCNSITGADGLLIDHEIEEDDGDDGDGDGDTTGGDPTGGQGGATAAAAGPGATTSAGPGGTGASGPGATASSGGPQCDYPTSNVGITIGATVSGNLSWQGYPEGSSQAATISIQDYYDCDGSKGVNAILLLNSATWCGNCQQEASDLNANIAGGWAAAGIKVITLMVQNQSSQPATLPTAQQWKDNFGLTTSAVVADPNFSFAGSGTIGLPLELIVDPRTMQIVDRQEGYSGVHTKLEQLAAQNAN
jgi:hypothetical protein